MESVRAACKSKFKSMHGARRNFIPTYLDEFLWRRKRSKMKVFSDLLHAITLQYPLPQIVIATVMLFIGRSIRYLKILYFA